MTAVDRLIQRWRISQACKYIPRDARLLDIGCSDASLFLYAGPQITGIGIDPDLDPGARAGNAKFIRGLFPEDLTGEDRGLFDAITMLAVLEHIPLAQQPKLASDCFHYLKPGGRLIITVPSPRVDDVVAFLKALHIVHGMAVEQHYGYDVNKTPALFGNAGLRLIHSGKFQFGLNNLFVFERPT
jgi:SAM-dependent methyltransferase